MAERDIKKYIEPSNKEIENILFHSWMCCCFSQCVNVNGCADICVCACVCEYVCVRGWRVGGCMVVVEGGVKAVTACREGAPSARHQ